MILVTLMATATLTHVATHSLPRTAPSAPTIVSSTPALDAVVDPGAIVLTATFDRPMRRRSYSFVQISADTYPRCAAIPTQSADRRSFALRCTVEPGHRYEIWFNRAPYLNFVGEDGVAAVPYRLRFEAR